MHKRIYFSYFNTIYKRQVSMHKKNCGVPDPGTVRFRELRGPGDCEVPGTAKSRGLRGMRGPGDFGVLGTSGSRGLQGTGDCGVPGTAGSRGPGEYALKLI